MKSFCQNCGSEIKSGKICSECGFKNQTPKGKLWSFFKKFFIVIFILSLIAGVAAYVLKDKIVSYYEGYTGEWKISFERKFAELQIEKADFDFSFYAIDAYVVEVLENGEATEFFKLKEALINQKYCAYHVFSQNFKCSEPQKIEYVKTRDDIVPLIRERIEKFDSITRTDCIKNGDKCIEYLDKKYNTLLTSCDKCNRKISELYQEALSVKDPNKTELLIGLVDLLRQENELINEHLKEVRLNLGLYNEVFSKMITEDEFNRSVALGYDFDEKFEEVENRKKIVDEKRQLCDKKKTEINDYVGMLNGALDTNLFTYENLKLD